MAYTISIKESAQDELGCLPKADRQLVEKKIIALGGNPRPAGATQLRGKKFHGLHRIRAGDYRVIYQVRDGELIVLVVKIGNRKDVYDR